MADSYEGSIPFTRSFTYENRLKTKANEHRNNRTELGIDLNRRGLYAADPFEGTWKLNESKSKLTSGTDNDTKKLVRPAPDIHGIK